MPSKKRFFGGLVGANPLRSGSFQDPGSVARVSSNEGVVSIDSAGPESSTTTITVLGDYSTKSETQFSATSATSGDQFGHSAAMSGDGTIVVFGDIGQDTTATDSGAAYVYENGTQVAILKASDAGASDNFGTDVAISKDGSVIAVGAPLWDTTGASDAGAVYVYVKPAGGWATTSSEDAKLTRSSPYDFTYLGAGVAISDDGNTIVASAYMDPTDSGLGGAYVYQKPGSGWTSATETAALTGSDVIGSDRLGYGLAISGDGTVIALGAPNADEPDTNCGAVYVYDRSGSTWSSTTETHKVVRPNPTGNHYLGRSCALNEDGTILVAGMPGVNSSQGFLCVFEDSGGTWSESKLLVLSSGGAANQELGDDVAISRDGSLIIAGVPGYSGVVTDGGALVVWEAPATGGWANRSGSLSDYIITDSNTAISDGLGGRNVDLEYRPHTIALSNDGRKALAGVRGAGSTGNGILFTATGGNPGTATTSTQTTQWFWGGLRGRDAIVEGSGGVGDDKSLRFDGSGDYLKSSTLGEPTDSTKTTASVWYKRASASGVDQIIRTESGGSTPWGMFYFDSATGTEITHYEDTGSGAQITRFAVGSTGAAEVGVWHHIVFAIDTSLSGTNRTKMWIDGTQLSVNSGSGASSNSLTVNGGTIHIGQNNQLNQPFDGQMAEIHVIDGQALDPTYFGETRDGVWVPKEVTGVTYGNNGFYLDFKGNDTGVTLLLDGTSKTSDVVGLATISATSGITTTTASPDAYDVTGGAVLQSADDDQGIYITGTNLFTINEDFTLEAWVKIDAESSNNTLFRIGNNTYASLLGHSPSSGTWKLWLPNATDTNWSTSAATLFTGLTAGSGWHHIAITKSGTTFRGFVDGVQTSADIVNATTFPIGSGSLEIGLGNGTPGNGYGTDGQWQDIRYTKGYARYSGSFTPPTSALSADVSGITGSDDVVLMLDGSGGGSATITDNSSANNDMTNVSTGVSNSNITGPYGTTQDVLDFDGSNDYLEDTITGSNGLLLGTDNFTFETWVKLDSISIAWGRIFEIGEYSSSGGFRVTLNDTTGKLYMRTSSVTGISSTVLNTTDWYHIAATRSGDTFTLFINGSQEIQFTDSGYSIGATSGTHSIFRIGAGQIGNGNTAPTNYIDGKIADFRITKGAALYPFHPPASALTNTPEYLGDFGVDRTTDGTGVTLLLDGTSTTDASDAGNNVTLVNATANNTSTTKYSSGSFYFDGAGTTNAGTADYVEIPDAAVDGWGTDDWTIEFWVKPASIGSRQLLCGSTPSSGSDIDSFLIIEIDGANGDWDAYVSDGISSSTHINGTIAATTNWQHLAAVRNGQTVSLFVNGALAGSATVTHGVARNASTSTSYRIGVPGAYDGGVNFGGYIENIRITRGVARDIASGFSSGTPISNGGWDVSLTNDDTWDKPKNDFTVEGNITPDDQLLDTPNLRFAALDPDFRGGTTGEVLSEGNLKYYCPINNENYVAATDSKTSGKWYFETLYDGSTNNTGQGIVGWTYDDISQATSNGVNPADLDYGGMFAFFGWVIVDTASATAVLQAPSANDVIGVAFDADTQRIWFSVQGSWVEGNPDTGTVATSYGALTSGKTYIPFIGHYSNSSTRKTQAILNFGQDHTFAGEKPTLVTPYSDINGVGEFYYQPPSGFLALADNYVVTDTLATTGVLSTSEMLQASL